MASTRLPFPRRWLVEGTEINSQIIEDTGWYVLIFGQWCWDENQEGDTPNE